MRDSVIRSASGHCDDIIFSMIPEKGHSMFMSAMRIELPFVSLLSNDRKGPNKDNRNSDIPQPLRQVFTPTGKRLTWKQIARTGNCGGEQEDKVTVKVQTT